MQNFLYTVVTSQPDWDFSFLGKEMSALVVKWRVPVPLSDDLPVSPLPPEDHPEQVINADPIIHLEEGDVIDDDLEQIDDPREILDHQDN